MPYNPLMALDSATRVDRTTDTVTTVAFVNLGCAKNLVDSEKMLGLLAEDGLILTDDEAQADAIVINTCGFLEASKTESLAEIERAATFKTSGCCKRLVVAGCLAQRHRAKMLHWCSDIDAIIGVFDRDRIVQAVRGVRPSRGDPAPDVPVYSSIAANATIAARQRGVGGAGYYESDTARWRLTPRHYAYLRVSDGCNQNCAFCTIPSIRGKMRSKPVEAVVHEMRELIADGAFELILIGQDTTSYGQDIGYGPGLAGLLKTLNDVAAESPGSAWIRLMYAYPSCFTDPMIEAIANLPHVVKYIDMPIQHINDTVLQRMRRRTSRKLIETLLGKLRRRAAGIALRTTLISGFPGETDAQHDELVAFVKDFGFEAMGVFAYSPEPGTPAGAMHGAGQAVPDPVVSDRIDELMRVQQQVVFCRHRRLADTHAEVDVLIDATPSDGESRCVGRTSRQAPQIDGVCFVESAAERFPGELVRCRVIGADGYDLVVSDEQNRGGGHQ